MLKPRPRMEEGDRAARARGEGRTRRIASAGAAELSIMPAAFSGSSAPALDRRRLTGKRTYSIRTPRRTLGLDASPRILLIEMRPLPKIRCYREFVRCSAC
jgi:hypothetical protein